MTIILTVGRILALLGAVLLLLAMSRPWMTVTITNDMAARQVGDVGGAPIAQALPRELHIAMSGSELSSFAAFNIALAPKLVYAIDQFTTMVSNLTGDPRVARQLREQLDNVQSARTALVAALIGLWQLPVAAITLASVLLVSNTTLRFRRGFGGLIVLIGIVSLVTLVLIRLRIDSIMPLIRDNRDVRAALDNLEDAGIAVRIQSESGLTQAPVYALLLLLGGLTEALLPLGLRTAPAPAVPNLPALQLPGAPPLQSASGIAAFEATATPRIVAQGACPTCGSPTLPTAHFCKSCGTSLH
jgi:hypothetical protein